MVTGEAVDKVQAPHFGSEPLAEKMESNADGNDAISQSEGGCGQV